MIFKALKWAALAFLGHWEVFLVVGFYRKNSRKYVF
jgi:hypothetical protein